MSSIIAFWVLLAICFYLGYVVGQAIERRWWRRELRGMGHALKRLDGALGGMHSPKKDE